MEEVVEMVDVEAKEGRADGVVVGLSASISIRMALVGSL